MPPDPGTGSASTSFPELRYPSLRDAGLKDATSWLQGKALDDGAEGLWRVHHKLYDLRDFISRHPGGGDWLTLTQGTDITEAFESHHLTLYPEKLLESFYIRDATTPRNSPFTFREDGFYRVLKARVREQLKDVPKSLDAQSKRVIDFLAISTFTFAVIASNCNASIYKILFSVLSALFLTWTTICAHNFFHQKDNWRMYLFNLGMMSSREWRVTHVLSHHLYPNTLMDFEISTAEPFFNWLVRKDKPFFQRFAPWLYSFTLYATLTTVQVAKSTYRTITKTNTLMCEPVPVRLLPLLLPLVMFLLGGDDLATSLMWWVGIAILSSFFFGLIGFNAAHHHPDIFHDGDEPLPDRDWGLHQLDAVMDRVEISGSLFRVLTNFGDHALHHLFPTLDHARLALLQPVVEQTCREYGASLRVTTQLDLLLGQFRQLARVESRKQRN